MEFAFGQSVFRDRRRLVDDPYNPDNQTLGSWEDALDTITVESASIASSSSVAVSSATRTELLTSKSLYCTDPTVDVQAGDRIRVAGDPPYYVHVRPSADINPFTGWQPVVEIPLELVEG